MAEVLIEFSRWQWLVTAAAFLLFSGLEFWRPYRPVTEGRRPRWLANLTLYISGTGLALMVAPLILGLGASAQAVIGMRPMVSLGMPPWLLILVSILVIDLLGYLTHAAFHRLPWLWKVHRVHHSDRTLDASTGVRHHPLEALASSFVQLILFAVLGLPLLVILAYGLVANIWQFISHSNLGLPPRLDRVVRWVLVTPDMHRLHHSVLLSEGNRNFGMVLSIWDRLFGTYISRDPAYGRLMDLGLEGGTSTQGVKALLGLPFKP